jgi:hypothetical protein
MALTREDIKDIGQQKGDAVFDELKAVTKANLASEYQKLYDLSEEIIHFSRRCNLEATLNRFNNASRSAERLKEMARQRYEDGLITASEYIEILKLTEEAMFREVPSRIITNLVRECNCKVVS